MIGLDQYDGEQQTTSELPEKPLKEWRRKFEASNLVSSNLMQYFQAASPFFFTIDQTAEYSDLGKFTFDSVHYSSVDVKKIVRNFHYKVVLDRLFYHVREK